MVTGKNKEQFEKWYLERVHSQYDYKRFIPSHPEIFEKYPFEMQIGVYLSYYDSLGVDVSVDDSVFLSGWSYSVRSDDYRFSSGVVVGMTSRQRAYRDAFETADEILNK